MRVDAFDFDLPERLIALRPVRPRSAARLLVAEGGGLQDRHFRDLPAILRAGDLLVFNDTRVLPVRLSGTRRRGAGETATVARIEVTLTERQGPDLWDALARPARRLRTGDLIAFADLAAEVVGRGEGGAVLLRFDRAGAVLDRAIERVGAMPLPPYIAGRRPADARDREDYQTRLARRDGAVAAPTAALHFDEALLAALDGAGIERCTVTLHVGPGTFLPVTAEYVHEHRMHAEWGEIDAATAGVIARARAEGRRVIPVGTTALRLIETAAAGG
ncbi:MAG: tRNA preQ1(34) S-adenosylmethionine ribosyltransferase-isomerase QueA, partial [Alphaproteobacteria bacterium]